MGVAMKQLNKSDHETETQKLFTRKQTAGRLSCSEMTLKRLEKRGRLTRVLIGLRTVRYRIEEIQALEGAK